MTWWIALTQPCCERRASARLVERGFDPWYPTRDVEIINRFTKQMKRKPTRSYPLFPGYLFLRPSGTRPLYSVGDVDGRRVKIKIGEEPHQVQLHEADGVDGFRAVLCNDFRPLLLSDAEVERVRAYAADIAPAQEWQPYAGQPVRVVDGPLAGHVGPIEFLRGQSAAVLFDILGRPTPVLVPVKDLRRAA